LGTLFVLMPHRVHPLWYSSVLPVLFLVSAVGAGLAMVVVESTLSAAGLKHRLEHHLLAKLAGAIPYVLGLYLVIRVVDLILAGDIPYLFTGDFLSISFWFENLVGVILPIILFSVPAVKRKPYHMFGAALLVVFGLMANRMYISLVAFNAGAYAPTWEELFITIGLVTLGALIFTLASRYLPVFDHETVSPPESVEDKPAVEMKPVLTFSGSPQDAGKTS
jgi:Ni/Fe-hydrogenase subunit HybB-like protein